MQLKRKIFGITLKELTEIYIGKRQEDVDLGSQKAGTYLQRDRTIYWDEQTQSGEQVASSIYFYTLKAADYVSTQKMIILK